MYKKGFTVHKTANNDHSVPFILRIKWDQSLDSSKFIVAFEDRFIGIIERAFEDFDWDSDLASVGPDVLAIPQHRVQYFKYGNRVVWKKENRLDDFFGSTGGGKTIIDVIKEEQQLSELVEDNNQMPNYLAKDLECAVNALSEEATLIKNETAADKVSSLPMNENRTRKIYTV